MGDFSPAWLDRREPADRLAHSPRVLNAMGSHFRDRDSLMVCDLGAGTGATLRAVHSYLPPHQQWTLVDHAEENLAAATTRLARLLEERPKITVAMKQADLAADPVAWADDTDLVTASALFDLTAPQWIERFVAALNGRPLLALLTYDGRLRFSRFAAEDTAMAEAFNNHQQTDKGFGPAAGPQAASLLRRALEEAGYSVTAGDSSWYLGYDFSAMRQDMMNGWIGAAREMGVENAVIDRWRAAHGDPDDRLVVGHTDLWAAPSAG